MSFAPTALDPARRRLTLLAMCVGQGTILLDNTIVNVALPAIQRGLRVTPLSVAAAAGAWRSGLDGLSAAARAEAPGLVQKVAGAEAHAVAAVLGPPALEPALHAFMTGYRMALTVAGALLLVGAVIAFATLRPRATGASTAAR